MEIIGRENLMKCPAYWLQIVQADIFAVVFDRTLGRGINALSKRLNVSKHTARQILRAEYNGTLQELTEILTQMGYRIKLEKIDHK